MKVLLVGGTWDNEGGKPSKLIGNHIYFALNNTLRAEVSHVKMLNGGTHYNLFDKVNALKKNNTLHPFDVILWFPNVPNEIGKHINVKDIFPKAILVTFKNNYNHLRSAHNRPYSFQELVAHALSLKSNLFVEIVQRHHAFYGQVFDPLGNAWGPQTSNFTDIISVIIRRSRYLSKITRKPTVWSPEVPTVIPHTDETYAFFEIVKKSADKFHQLLNPANSINRFLGNASFRCTFGFPSLRTRSNIIFVSKRNVDKRALNHEQFVQVGYNSLKEITWYRGDHKPSVDTVIQIQLYRLLHKIRFMIHSHVYVENAPYTKNMVPCGGLEEIKEIERALCTANINPQFGFAINLIGHGSLICGQIPEDFNQYKYTARPAPELQYYNK